MPTLELLDTTLRDGAQGEGIEFSLDDKRKIALALDRLGVPLIEGGNPFASPKDAAFFQEAKATPFLRQAALVPFGSTCRSGTQAAKDPGLAALLATGQHTLSLFGKSSLMHVKQVLQVPPEENLRMIEDSVRFLTEKGCQVLYDGEHFFDGFQEDRAYALQTLAAAARGGARVLVLCDTNGGALPQAIAQALAEAKRALPQAAFGIHCHDDMGLAVAGTIAGAQAGASMVQGTMAGVGERCGNANLCTFLPTLQLKLGYTLLPPENLPLLTETSRTIVEIMNIQPNPRAPYVGYSAFAHKGGMHIDGVSKNAATFEHLAPEAVGNRRRLILSGQAGRSGVYSRLKRLLPELTRDDPRVQSVTQRLKRQEGRGYAYENADGSFDLMALDTLGLRKSFFQVKDFHVLSGDRAEDRSAQAYIKIAVEGREEINAAEGDGPVNALDSALRKALMVFYPSLENMRLRDFKVRVLDSGGTASTVRVLIESTDGKSVWTTLGVSSNIIQACFKALCDSVEYYLAFIAFPSP